MNAGANTGYITSAEDLRRLADKVIADGQPIALDCETGYAGESRSYKNTSPSLHAEESLLAGYNFTNSAGWARYVPLDHEEARYNIEPRLAARALWDMTQTGLAVVHNGDMEERRLSRFLYEHLADDPEVGEQVRASRGYFPLRSDTMMEAHALARWEKIALKYLSRAVFGYDQTELLDLFNQVLGNGKPIPQNKRHTLRFNVLDPSDPRVYGYACDDAIQTWRLHDRHYEQVKDNFIYWLEMNVWPIVWAMEDEGLAMDWDFIDEAKERAAQFRVKMQTGMVSHLVDRLQRVPTFNGKPFNPNSFPQLGKLLYDPPPEGLGLKTHIKTKGKADGTGKKPSTNAIALKGLSGDPFVQRLRDYRGMSKLLGTYLEPWRREFGWAADGRAHCHLLPHGTVTGRFSSSDFNYQNLPKKYHYECDGEVFELNFRDSVTVPAGHIGMGFDISQGELRIIAAEAGEQAMLEAFTRGEDLHALTASRLLHVSMEEVYAGGDLFGKPVDSFRPFGKTMNFALGYQLTVQGLADRLGCSQDEAQQAFDGYFAAYPAIAAWTRRTVADSKVNGYTQSRLGRRHPIWAYASDKSWIYAGGERTAGNAPIQGGLADMMKLIMIRCDRAVRKAGLAQKVRMVMNIHDALEYYVALDVPPQLVIDVLTPAIIEQTPWTQHWPVMQPDWHVWKRWGSQTELKLDERYQLIGMGDVKDIGLQEDDDDDSDEGGAEIQEKFNAAGLSISDPDANSSRPPLHIASAAADLGGSPDGVGTDAVRDRPAGPRRTHSGTVLVRVGEMPEMAAARRLLAMIAEFPGPNQMVLDTPEGRVTISTGTSLSPDDSGRIVLVLGGGQVVWDTASVDNDALAEGLALLEVGSWRSLRGSRLSTTGAISGSLWTRPTCAAWLRSMGSVMA